MSAYLQLFNLYNRLYNCNWSVLAVISAVYLPSKRTLSEPLKNSTSRSNSHWIVLTSTNPLPPSIIASPNLRHHHKANRLADMIKMLQNHALFSLSCLALYLFYYATLLPLPFSPFSLCNVVFCNRLLFFFFWSSCHHRRPAGLPQPWFADFALLYTTPPQT